MGVGGGADFVLPDFTLIGLYKCSHKFHAPSLPGSTLKVFGGGGGWWWVVIESNFSVLLWSKTGILSLYSELDQAEQKCEDGDEHENSEKTKREN